MSIKSIACRRVLIATAAAAVAVFSATPGHAEIVTMTFSNDGPTVSGSLSFDPSLFVLKVDGLNGNPFFNTSQIYGGPATFTATIGSNTYSASSLVNFYMSNATLTGQYPYYFEAQALSNSGLYMDLNSSSQTPLFNNPNDPGSFFSQQISGEFFLSPDILGSSKLLFDPVTINVAAVPEPSTWAMMIFGFFSIGFMAYRKKAALGLA